MKGSLNRALLFVVVAFMCIYLFPSQVFGSEGFLYSKACSEFHLKPVKQKFSSAAAGIAARESYEKQGMEFHRKGHWLKSNCLLVHALNISSDHAGHLFMIVGFNYAALGNDKEALSFFTDSTAYSFDLDTWLDYKSRKPFKKILSKPIYKNFEKSLYQYYHDTGLEIPQ